MTNTCRKSSVKASRTCAWSDNFLKVFLFNKSCFKSELCWGESWNFSSSTRTIWGHVRVESMSFVNWTKNSKILTCSATTGTFIPWFFNTLSNRMIEWNPSPIDKRNIFNSSSGNFPNLFSQLSSIPGNVRL